MRACPDAPFLLFDLDGTISDPLEGIWRSMNYALETLGHGTISKSDCMPFVGPPLDASFRAVTGLADAAKINVLIEKYRERYIAKGYAENKLYPDVLKSIKTLAAKEVPMAVCTSKRRDMAEKILQLFNIQEYFQFVNGGDVGIEKWQQIEGLLADHTIEPSAIMIGDRSSDLIAAHRNGLQSAGVLWGFGSDRELEAELPRYLFSQPAELLQFTESQNDTTSRR